jgi:signal transduction histidine kinase
VTTPPDTQVETTIEKHEDLASENARLRAELRRLHAEREVRDRFFTQFIGIVGHDLRSPLSAIVMATALLGKVPLDERAARALMRIHTSSKRAERLIRDLVDCARASAGIDIPLSRTTMDLHEVARQTIDELALAYPDRRITLSVSGQTRGEWDYDRMGQVVANLVTHAVRGSAPDRDVRVEVDGDDGEVRIIVCCNAEPIEPAVLEHLFEPFARTGEGSDGISLYIVAEIVKAHGGRVEARSSRAEGTTLIAHLTR